MRTIRIHIKRYPCKVTLAIGALVCVGLYLLIVFTSLSDVEAVQTEQPFNYRYSLDVLSGEDRRRIEIKVSATYIVTGYPKGLKFRKLNIRVCLLGSLQKHVIRRGKTSIELLLELRKKEIEKDIIACMDRLRNVTIGMLVLEFGGVEDKGPFHFTPSPERPERPSAPTEDEGVRSLG